MKMQESASIPKFTRKDLIPGGEVKWCPGCGDYAILASIQKILPELNTPRENFVFVSGIGCSSRFPYYMNTYGLHSIHGRAPAVATGVKLANPKLSVWVMTGDGDAMSIGGNHLIHALRRNLDLKIVMFNNEIYGLTKGQYSPTTQMGQVTKSSPYGVPDYPFSPLRLALGAGATFVARAFDVDGPHLQAILKEAALHKGSAFIEIWQNCVVFNDSVFDPIVSKESRPDHLLYLEEGQPLLFGKDKEKAVVVEEMSPKVVPASEAPKERLLVHKPGLEDPAYAFLISGMTYPEFPVPMGIFRNVQRPTYDEILGGQVEKAKAKAKDTSFKALFDGLETWTIN
jgi:2-oxoglutarate ferredoxin oxidoreductase subunit beta